VDANYEDYFNYGAGLTDVIPEKSPYSVGFTVEKEPFTIFDLLPVLEA
jgi:hypothetical protein